jgi:hypothetical protein
MEREESELNLILQVIDKLEDIDKILHRDEVRQYT